LDDDLRWQIEQLIFTTTTYDRAERLAAPMSESSDDKLLAFLAKRIQRSIEQQGK
jgi:hypothetical protein